MVNPYEARRSPTDENQQWTVRRIAALVCWCYPVILIAGLYGTWALAGIVLGHTPRPMFDRPHTIHFLVTMATYLCTVWLAMFPFFAIYGAIGELFPKNDVPPQPGWRLVRLLLFGFLWSVCFGYLRWDPHGVVQWCLD